MSAGLRLQIGARTIATIPRRLRRVALSLEEALGGVAPVLPGLAEEDGYLVTSLPEGLDPAELTSASPAKAGAQLGGSHDEAQRFITSTFPTGPRPSPGKREVVLIFERQRYVRYYVDLAAGAAAWRAGLSGQARSGLKRKAKKLAEASGGAIDVRRFRSASELAAFHPVARALAETTYQERLMAAGLPGDAGFVARMAGLAAADAVRAWLLYVGGEPAAYLWCGADGGTLRYDYVGHDPRFAALSPGSVLMGVALDDLFADRFARFDFTEGEGQHKRGLASGGVACRDLLLLRPTIANRAAVAAVGGFDGAVALAKRVATGPVLGAVAKRVRRA